jgi:transposase
VTERYGTAYTDQLRAEGILTGDPTLSNRAVARRFGLTANFVASVRSEMVADGRIAQHRHRGGRPRRTVEAEPVDDTLTAQAQDADLIFGETRWRPSRLWLEEDRDVVRVRDELIAECERLRAENDRLQRLLDQRSAA